MRDFVCLFEQPLTGSGTRSFCLWLAVCDMRLVVRSFDTRLVDTSVCRSAADLKCLLASEDGLPLEDIQLYSGASILDSDTVLADLPVDCAIDVSVSVLGGMFS